MTCDELARSVVQVMVADVLVMLVALTLERTGAGVVAVPVVVKVRVAE